VKESEKRRQISKTRMSSEQTQKSAHKERFNS
jgi:hypothetical protein